MVVSLSLLLSLWAMSRQTLLCIPHPTIAEGGLFFFCIGVYIYFGVILVKRPKKSVYLAYSLKPNLIKLNIIILMILSDPSFERSCCRECYALYIMVW